MTPQWATTYIMGAGLVGNLLWTLINLRIENKILKRVDQLKDWADARYEMKDDAPARKPVRANGHAPA